MPSQTMRDKVWTLALMHTARMGEATTPEKIIEETEASERMVRQCLNVMSDNGFLRRERKVDGTIRYLPTEGEGL